MTAVSTIFRWYYVCGEPMYIRVYMLFNRLFPRIAIVRANIKFQIRLLNCYFFSFSSGKVLLCQQSSYLARKKIYSRHKWFHCKHLCLTSFRIVVCRYNNAVIEIHFSLHTIQSRIYTVCKVFPKVRSEEVSEQVKSLRGGLSALYTYKFAIS